MANGDTPLHTAVRSYDGDLYPLKMLLKQNDIDINVVNSRGDTPLHLAAQNETCFSEELIQFHLDNGADVNLVNVNGDTPLHLIAQNTAPLLQQFTKPILSIESLLLLKKEAEGVKEKAAPVRKPLSESVDSDLRDGGYSIVPRTIPASVKILLERGIDVNATNSVGDTPLHFAAENEIWCFYFLRMFLKKARDINAKNSKGETPLHWAVRSESCTVALVKLLLDNGADVNIQDSLRQNAYQAYCKAVSDRKDPMLEILLRSEEQQHMDSSLHVASLCHNVESVKKLLSNGADVNDVDKFVYPPLFFALIVYTDTSEKIANKSSVVKLLLHHGADINQQFPRFNFPTKYIFDYDMSLESLGFAGLVEGNREENRAMLDIFHNHKAKLLALHEKRIKMGILNVPMFSEFNVSVCGPVEGLKKTFKSEQQDLFLRCNEELTAMGETKVGESDVTFLDLLIADDKKMGSYAKNEKLMEAFRAEKDRFQLYEGMLVTKLAKGLKQNESVEDTSTLLSILVKSLLR